MNYPTEKILIECLTEPDWCGTWTRKDIEDEMKSLDIQISNQYDWLDYLFDHLFFEEAWRIQTILDVFMKNDELRMIAVYIDGSLVNFKKFRKS